jgi:hypothetical protein
MGVQFDRLDLCSAQTELDEFVDRSFFSNRKAQLAPAQTPEERAGEAPAINASA